VAAQLLNKGGSKRHVAAGSLVLPFYTFPMWTVDPVPVGVSDAAKREDAVLSYIFLFCAQCDKQLNARLPCRMAVFMVLPHMAKTLEWAVRLVCPDCCDPLGCSFYPHVIRAHTAIRKQMGRAWDAFFPALSWPFHVCVACSAHARVDLKRRLCVGNTDCEKTFEQLKLLDPQGMADFPHYQPQERLYTFLDETQRNRAKWSDLCDALRWAHCHGSPECKGRPINVCACSQASYCRQAECQAQGAKHHVLPCDKKWYDVWDCAKNFIPKRT
jgi:hypothetical protein